MEAMLTSTPRPQPTCAQLTVRAPTREQSRCRFDEIAASMCDIAGVRIIHSRRRIEIGDGLIIRVVSDC